MIELVKINKSFDKIKVFDNLSMKIKKNQVTCLLGPSGCGKSTLLKILSGLDKEYEGNIKGIDFCKISFVFQEARLVPWLTVYENLKYVLEAQVKTELMDSHINDYLKKVDLINFKNAYPNTLSGGMKQRVSLARAFAMPHDVLLLDEPFQNLDFDLKDQLMSLLEELIQQDQKTVVMVTHDLSEAKRLGDTIVKLIGRPISHSEVLQMKSGSPKGTLDNRTDE
ncbi:MAG: ABC transporter ATP-binding protein [Spirochaetes bacterium]|nr:ABC transporter ATP-binding protein [Spirochaetota bacterium]